MPGLHSCLTEIPSLGSWDHSHRRTGHVAPRLVSDGSEGLRGGLDGPPTSPDVLLPLEALSSGIQWE